MRASFFLLPSAGPGLPLPPAARMAASCPLMRAPRLEAGRGGWCPSRFLLLPAWLRSFPRLPKTARCLPQKKGP